MCILAVFESKELVQRVFILSVLFLVIFSLIFSLTVLANDAMLTDYWSGFDETAEAPGSTALS